MKFMLSILFFTGYAALSNSSLNELPVHRGVGALIKGPNSEIIIQGPDGSVITAQEEGGTVATSDLSQPIVVADTVDTIEPIVSAVNVAPGPSVTPIVDVAQVPAQVVTPISAVASAIPVGHTIEVIQHDPHIIETEIVDDPVVEPQQFSDLVGPSGSISTRGSSSIVSGPASTTISEPARIVVATPLIAAVPIISQVTTPLRAVPVIDSGINIPVAAYGSVNPTISSVTVGPPVVTASPSPQILVSPQAPSIDLASVTGIPINTLAPPTVVLPIEPPRVWETDNHISARLSLLTPVQSVLNPLSSTNVEASVQPSSSNGVINNFVNTIQVSSTPRSIVLPSTLAPSVNSVNGLGIVSTTPNTDFDVNNIQLNINPSLIPSANIIPPEIGPLPPGAVDLGSTISVSTTPRPPAIITPSESPNIQRIGNSNSLLVENTVSPPIKVDGRIDEFGNQISVKNQIQLSNPGILNELPPQPTIPLLRNTNPIPVTISRHGIVGTQLSNYGIDSSQIDLTNVPLSSISSFPHTLNQEIDDVSYQLWNRYGRDVKEKKREEQETERK